MNRLFSEFFTEFSVGILEVCETIWGSFWKYFGRMWKEKHQKNCSVNLKIYKNFISTILISTYGYLPLIYYFSFFLTGVALRKLLDENLGWSSSAKWNYLPVLMLIMVLGCKTFLEFFNIDLNTRGLE